jgi:hypothetical protein
MKELLSAALVAVMCGCSTVSTRFTETATDADGSSYTTAYKALSTAAPFGEVEKTNHEFRYKWGGKENSIGTGQGAQGIDNTGQTEALKQLIQSLTILTPFFQALAAPKPESPKPNIADLAPLMMK